MSEAEHLAAGYRLQVMPVGASDGRIPFDELPQHEREAWVTAREREVRRNHQLWELANSLEDVLEAFDSKGAPKHLNPSWIAGKVKTARARLKAWRGT
jgi:hypothetical protein